MEKKTIIIGSDHAGYEMKTSLTKYFVQAGYTYCDEGCYDMVSVDYPDYAKKVATNVLSDNTRIGILLCGSGIGVSITANRFSGIRAALCWTEEIARLSRQHNDANILCIPARFIHVNQAIEIVEVFMKTDFEGGRHLNRVKKIENE